MKKMKFSNYICNDGSKDNTFENLKLYSDKKFKTIIIKHKINTSQSSAILSE